MRELASIRATDLDGVRLVRVTGEIDLSNARHVMETIGDAVPGDAVLVVLDLSGVGYLDSSGIAMLFRLSERLGYSRQQLRLVVPGDAPIRAVLELTKLPQVIPVQEALDAPDPM